MSKQIAISLSEYEIFLLYFVLRDAVNNEDEFEIPENLIEPAAGLLQKLLNIYLELYAKEFKAIGGEK